MNASASTLIEIDWDKLATRYARPKHRQKVAASRSSYTPASPPGTPRFPPQINLREYQRQAISQWFRNRGRGTLKMATGSGKTITALAIAEELYRQIGLQVLLVICPYRHLVAQWSRECERFNLEPILAYESVHEWQSLLATQLYNLRRGERVFLTLITTNSTLISVGFQSQIDYFPPKTLIVGDEVHHLGASQLSANLPRQIGLRLALSATPERHYDESGTEAIFDYFGSVLQPEFTLADAIRQGALVPYFYHPILVELTEVEAFTYAKLTQRIGWAIAENDYLPSNKTLTSLLMQRSRLVGAAANKLIALRELMSQRLHTTHTLFYCGDGSIETPISQGVTRQLSAVTRLLGTELGYRVNTYTADTPIEQRENLRQQLDRGELQGLVAIRCLDEGIDIPAVRTAIILASTANPRQFIQRRGRILRPHPGKKYATLFDMVVLPPDLDRETWQVERNLLRRELKRLLEFADLAENASAARRQLAIIQTQYGLLDL